MSLTFPTNMLYAILSGVTNVRLRVPMSGEVRNTPLHREKKIKMKKQWLTCAQHICIQQTWIYDITRPHMWLTVVIHWLQIYCLVGKATTTIQAWTSSTPQCTYTNPNHTCMRKEYECSIQQKECNNSATWSDWEGMVNVHIIWVCMDVYTSDQQNGYTLWQTEHACKIMWLQQVQEIKMTVYGITKANPGNSSEFVVIRSLHAATVSLIHMPHKTCCHTCMTGWCSMAANREYKIPVRDLRVDQGNL